MNKAMIGTLLAGAIALAPLAAQAGTTARTSVTPNRHAVAWRLARQQSRINEGLQTGRLSAREYAADESHLRAAEAMNATGRLADGKLSHQERAAIDRDLNNNSGRIYETKHNRVKGGGTSIAG
jgi:hypothetical protein